MILKFLIFNFALISLSESGLGAKYSFLKNSDYGTQSAFHVTLSLLDLSDDGRESWECILYECDDLSENEVKSASFDNGQIAVKYFVNQITNLYKN